MIELPDDVRTALVTGAAGFIGSHLASRLVAHGIRVVGVDNERSGDWNRLEVSVDEVRRDITAISVDQWRDLLDGVDVVLHLAAEKYNSSRSTPQRVIDTNITATQRLVDAAGFVGVRKVVFTSSLYAYGSMGPAPMVETDLPAPTTMYGMSKIAGEHLLRVAQRDHGLPWTVARLLFVYGPRQYAEGGYKSVIMTNFERIAAGDAPVVFGDGQQALDYVYVDDCVDALLAMVSSEHDGAVYNVASGRAATVAELTACMLDVAGSAALPVHADPDWTAGSVRAGDPTLAAIRLGWKAVTPLPDGVARVWKWMRSQHV